MNSWYYVFSISQIGQLFRLLQPSCLEQLVEGILTTAVDDTWAYNNDLDVLLFDGKDLFFDLFNVAVF